MAKTKKKLGKLTNKAIKIAQDRCKLGYFDVEGEEYVVRYNQKLKSMTDEPITGYTTANTTAPTANPDFAKALNLKAIHRKAVLKQIQVMINDNPIMDYECPDCNLEAIEVPATKNGYSKIRIINFLQKQGLIKKEVIHYMKTVGIRLTLRSKASQPQLTWLKRDYKSIMQVIDAFVAGYNSQASLLTQISLNEREFLVHKSVLEEKNAKVAEITREIETEFAYGSQGNNDKIARLLVSLQDIENN
jgi:hypothetical protein